MTKEPRGSYIYAVPTAFILNINESGTRFFSIGSALYGDSALPRLTALSVGLETPQPERKLSGGVTPQVRTIREAI